jgi:secreted trypsin-like serine protease
LRFESAQRRWLLAGLTSYGKDCGNPFYAGVYTRVATYIDWLRSIVDNDGLIMVDVDTSGVQSTGTTNIAISEDRFILFHFSFSCISSYLLNSWLID